MPKRLDIKIKQSNYFLLLHIMKRAQIFQQILKEFRENKN